MSRWLGMLDRLSKFLFGYDFFISYAYKDGREYAEYLVKKLGDLDFACFFDSSELPPGEQLPTSLRRAIGRSKALILVGTEGSIDAPYVDLEVSTALDQGKVIPIDVHGIRERVNSSVLRELPWVNEEPGVAVPSADVLARTNDYFHFTRRNSITRRALSFSAVAFFLVAVLAVWQWRVAGDQKTIAEQQRDMALSRQLASQSLGVLDAEPDLGLLLAAQAADLGATFEARDALLRAMQRRPNLVTLLHDAGSVRLLAFSPNAKLLASANTESEIILWNVDTNSRVARMDGSAISSLTFDRSSNFLVAYQEGEEPTVWDLSSDPPVLRADASDDLTFKLPSSEDEDSVSALIDRITEAGTTIRTTAVNPNGSILAVSDSEVVTLWSIPDGVQVGQPLSAQERHVRALAFGPGGLLASGSSAGTIALWNISERLLIGRSLKGLAVSANSLAFSPDGKELAGGDYNGDIVQWALGDSPLKQQSLSHGSNVHALRYGESGRELASYGGQELKVWDLTTQAPLKSITMSLKLQSVSAIGPQFRRAALGGNSGELALWDIDTGQPLPSVKSEHGDRLSALAFHPNGQIVAFAGNGRRIGLLEIATGQIAGMLEGHTAAIADLDFSGDGGRLASYDSEGTLIVWDSNTLEPVGKPLQIDDAYSATSAMALSPDGRIAVTSDRDGGLNLWDVETWRSLGAPLIGHGALVTTLEFSPDGAWLVSGGLGGKVILWDLRIETWQQRVCAIANRGFTVQESRAYLVTFDGYNKGVCDRT